MAVMIYSPFFSRQRCIGSFPSIPTQVRQTDLTSRSLNIPHSASLYECKVEKANKAVKSTSARRSRLFFTQEPHPPAWWLFFDVRQKFIHKILFAFAAMVAAAGISSFAQGDLGARLRSADPLERSKDAQ